MGKKWYGNLTNRLEEGRQDKPISIGDDITMYLWSDRCCYYVSEVINQKHIKVKPYFVCADKSKPGGIGHQNWMYFKSFRNFADYVSIDREVSEEECKTAEQEQTWVFRYNKWVREVVYTASAKFDPEAGLFFDLTERDKKSLEKNGYYKKYFDLSGKISFGVRDYYHDWEF